jgi:transposase
VDDEKKLPLCQYLIDKNYFSATELFSGPGFRRRRRRIETAFNRLKDFRRIATRYDRLARNYLASVCLAAALVWWI